VAGRGGGERNGEAGTPAGGGAAESGGAAAGNAAALGMADIAGSSGGGELPKLAPPNRLPGTLA
jgi:hypothetical protein